jgi:MFS family permease
MKTHRDINLSTIPALVFNWLFIVQFGFYFGVNISNFFILITLVSVLAASFFHFITNKKTAFVFSGLAVFGLGYFVLDIHSHLLLILISLIAPYLFFNRIGWRDLSVRLFLFTLTLSVLWSLLEGLNFLIIAIPLLQLVIIVFANFFSHFNVQDLRILLKNKYTVLFFIIPVAATSVFVFISKYIKSLLMFFGFLLGMVFNFIFNLLGLKPIIPLERMKMPLQERISSNTTLKLDIANDKQNPEFISYDPPLILIILFVLVILFSAIYFAVKKMRIKNKKFPNKSKNYHSYSHETNSKQSNEFFKKENIIIRNKIRKLFYEYEIKVSNLNLPRKKNETVEGWIKRISEKDVVPEFVTIYNNVRYGEIQFTNKEYNLFEKSIQEFFVNLNNR